MQTNNGVYVWDLHTAKLSHLLRHIETVVMERTPTTWSHNHGHVTPILFSKKKKEQFVSLPEGQGARRTPARRRRGSRSSSWNEMQLVPRKWRRYIHTNTRHTSRLAWQQALCWLNVQCQHTEHIKCTSIHNTQRNYCLLHSSTYLTADGNI
jgi:hypothetical protein